MFKISELQFVYLKNRNRIHSFIQKQDADIHIECNDIISILKIMWRKLYLRYLDGWNVIRFKKNFASILIQNYIINIAQNICNNMANNLKTHAIFCEAWLPVKAKESINTFPAPSFCPCFWHVSETRVFRFQDCLLFLPYSYSSLWWGAVEVSYAHKVTTPVFGLSSVDIISWYS